MGPGFISPDDMMTVRNSITSASKLQWGRASSARMTVQTIKSE